MKKLFFSLVLAFFAIGMLSAQSVQEQTVTFDKAQTTAYTISTTAYTPEIVMGAVAEKLEKKEGKKASKYAGYKAFLAQQFPQLSTQNLDVYIKAETTGKKKAQSTVVTLLVSTGNNNFITPATDAATVEKIKTFLAELLQYTEGYNKTQKVAANNKTIEKLEKEVKKMNKEFEKIDKEIKDKKAEIEKLKQENTNLQN